MTELVFEHDLNLTSCCVTETSSNSAFSSFLGEVAQLDI